MLGEGGSGDREHVGRGAGGWEFRGGKQQSWCPLEHWILSVSWGGKVGNEEHGEGKVAVE